MDLLAICFYHKQTKSPIVPNGELERCKTYPVNENEEEEHVELMFHFESKEEPIQFS